ncbi:hypothetical protein [Bacillus tropicus]
MRKKSTLSNFQSISTLSKGNTQPNSFQTTPSTLIQQGYKKKTGCGCGKK